MKLEGWKYYNHAVIPATAPHEEPDTTPILDGSVWKNVGQKAFLARWTTAFDCGQETQWWYCIKDTPYDPMLLNSKKRYTITKGRKHFDVRIIDLLAHKEDLYRVQTKAFAAYPSQYRPHITKDTFEREIRSWNNFVILGAFLRESEELCGYVLLREQANCVHLPVLKTAPEYEKMQVNAALVDAVLQHYSNKLGSGFYICDGERNILHETAFQEYLEKYFGFRKAYCKLHILYRKPFGLIVNALMVFRKMLRKMDGVGLVNKINGVLLMEEIYRSQVTQK